MFKKLVSIEEAKKILEKSLTLKPVGVEEVPLQQVFGRILAEDVEAEIDVPHFHRATVDGYAVKAEDTFRADEENPIKLKVSGRVLAGDKPTAIIKNGCAIEVATGAALPRGANAVVMVEYTSRENDSILVYKPVSLWENVMKIGSDIKKEEKVLRKGQVVSSREIGVLAALGKTRIKVYKKPKVAVLSTGAEVVEPGKPLEEGKIYDINTYTLSAAVREAYGEPVNMGIVVDKAEEIRNTLARALNIADIVITSGGVSVGPTDVVPKVLSSLGKPGVIVCGVASKPGKPTTIAIIDGKPVFSLPGHPTSSLLMFYIFARPVIAAMAGATLKEPVFVKAKTTEKVFSARGRRTFIMVKLTRDRSGKLLASPILPGVSGAITTLMKAEGFIEIKENQQFINSGEEVIVQLLDFNSSPLMERSR